MKNQDSYRMIIESDLNNIHKIEQITEKIAKNMHFSEEEQDSLAISVTEIVGNAIVHGNKRDKNKRGQVPLGNSEFVTQNIKLIYESPVMLWPVISMSIPSADGTLGRPGMSITSPEIGIR